MNLTERDEFLLTMYHCDHIKFSALCDEFDCDRVDFINENLSGKEITQAIDNYNRRTFGVSFEECKKRMCLLCKDFDKCSLPEREKYEKRNTREEAK